MRPCVGRPNRRCRCHCTQERKEAQRLAKLEFERERAMVDEIARRIAEEEQMEAEAKRRKQEDTRQYIQQFLLEQEEMRMRQVAEEVRAAGSRVHTWGPAWVAFG